MEDIFLLPKAKAPVIFKVKTASALEFHILFFAFCLIRPADFTLCYFFLLRLNCSIMELLAFFLICSVPAFLTSGFISVVWIF